jgi:hypothetical protein
MILEIYLWFAFMFLLDYLVLLLARLTSEEKQNIPRWKFLLPLSGCYYFWKYRVK